MTRAKLTAAQMKIAGLHFYAALAAAATLLLVVTGADAASRRNRARAGASDGSGSSLPPHHWIGSVADGGGKAQLVARLGLDRAGGSGCGVRAGSMGGSSVADDLHGARFSGASVAVSGGGNRRRDIRKLAHDPVMLQDQGWPSLRGVARNTLVVVVIQVALGAAFRYGSINVMTHILGALVVTIFILTLVVLVTLMPEHPTLRQRRSLWEWSPLCKFFWDSQWFRWDRQRLPNR